MEEYDTWRSQERTYEIHNNEQNNKNIKRTNTLTTHTLRIMIMIRFKGSVKQVY